MIAFAMDRVAKKVPMSGVFLMRPGTSIRDAVEAIAMVALCSDPSDWAGQIHWLPF
jgi:hypothetical protein